MYGVGHGKLSDSFKEYVAKRQYYLKNLGEIKEVSPLLINAQLRHRLCVAIFAVVHISLN